MVGCARRCSPCVCRFMQSDRRWRTTTTCSDACEVGRCGGARQLRAVADKSSLSGTEAVAGGPARHDSRAVGGPWVVAGCCSATNPTESRPTSRFAGDDSDPASPARKILAGLPASSSSGLLTCIIDPEGDYRSPKPSPTPTLGARTRRCMRELVRAAPPGRQRHCRFEDFASRENRHLNTLLPCSSLQTPHDSSKDSARRGPSLSGGAQRPWLIDAELPATFVTADSLDLSIRETSDAVVMVTRERRTGMRSRRCWASAGRNRARRSLQTSSAIWPRTRPPCCQARRNPTARSSGFT